MDLTLKLILLKKKPTNENYFSDNIHQQNIKTAFMLLLLWYADTISTATEVNRCLYEFKTKLIHN